MPDPPLCVLAHACCAPFLVIVIYLICKQKLAGSYRGVCYATFALVNIYVTLIVPDVHIPYIVYSVEPKWYTRHTCTAKYQRVFGGVGSLCAYSCGDMVGYSDCG